MPHSPLNILLVEDNPGDARLIEVLLSEHDPGGAFIHAPTLAQALALIERHAAPPVLLDLILLDLTLPDSDSLDTLRAIRTRAPGLPIVILSGRADEELAVYAVREGAQDYLVKGRIDAQVLSRAVRYAIERKSAQRERELAQEALAVSEERFRLVTEASTDGIWDRSLISGEVYWSDRMFDLLGVPRSTPPRAETSFMLVHPDDQGRYDAALKGAITSGANYLNAEVRILRAPGVYGHFRIAAKIVRDSSGAAVRLAGSLSDITERRRAEQALRDADEQLRQSQKMEAVGQLASGVAHDFNNLLTAIRGYASLARNTLHGDHPALESLDQVEEASRQAAGVASALLTFARKAHTEKSPVNLAQAVESATRLFRRTLPASVHLVVDTSHAEDLWVQADSTQLQQVVINLAINARDAIVAGAKGEGTMTISVQTAGPGAQPSVSLIVRDTGQGMTPDIRARIFEPFFTTKPRGRGTGLGLAVIHGIVQDHSGTITVLSAPGQGATFTVTFPQIEPPAARPAPSAAVTSEAIGRGGLAVLVVANQLVRGLLASMLAALGYEITHASSAEQALSVAGSADQPIDLLVVDQNLAGRDGTQLLSDLRARGQNTRAVIVAAANAVPNEPPDPSVVLLHKPFQLADLRSAIAELDSPDNAESPA